MHNEFETWLKNNAPAGQGWASRLWPAVAAVTATVVVGLSVVMMAGLGLPAGEAPLEARAPVTAPATAQPVRYAEALPTVTIVGKRAPGEQEARPAAVKTAALPARPASAESAPVGIAAAGDNLRQ